MKMGPWVGQLVPDVVGVFDIIDMPRMQQRSKYKSYGALRGCDLGVRDCLQVYCGK